MKNMSILSPFLSLPPLAAVILVAFLVSLGINIIYKYATDQKKMKALKEEISAIQKQAKGESPEKGMQLQKKALGVNMEYFKHSLKPTLYTMLPVLLVFMWMSSHYSYLPISPEKEFTTTLIFEEGTSGNVEIIPQAGIEIIGENIQPLKGNATFTLKGKAGEYLIEFMHNGKKYNKEVLITNEQSYAKPSEKITGNSIKEIRINNEKPTLMNLFGWKVGWLGTYIIFSLIFSIVLRKVMNLY